MIRSAVAAGDRRFYWVSEKRNAQFYRCSHGALWVPSERLSLGYECDTGHYDAILASVTRV